MFQSPCVRFANEYALFVTYNFTLAKHCSSLEDALGWRGGRSPTHVQYKKELTERVYNRFPNKRAKKLISLRIPSTAGREAMSRRCPTRRESESAVRWWGWGWDGNVRS